MLDIVENSSNTVVIGIGNHQFLYSYKTLVAGFYSGIGYIKSNIFYSVTTSKHVNRFTGNNPVLVTESELQALLLTAIHEHSSKFMGNV